MRVPCVIALSLLLQLGCASSTAPKTEQTVTRVDPAAPDPVTTPNAPLPERQGSSKPLTNPFVAELPRGAAGAEVRIANLDPTDTLLSEGKQQQIWDAEHVTHMLEWRFGKQLREELFGRQAALAAHFSEELSGSTLPLDQGASHSLASVRERSGDRESLEATPCTQKDLVAWLESVASEFSQVQASSFRVLYIDQEDSEEGEERWWARVLLSARGTDTSQKLREFSSEHTVRFSWTDEKQLYQDAAVDRWSVENFAIRESDGQLMREVTSEAGFLELDLPDNWTDKTANMMSTQLAVEDFDRDGYLDIALANGGGQQLLLRNVNGTRFQIAAKFPPKVKSRLGWDFSVGVLDFDRDGFSDLLIGRRLYRNEQGRKFTDVTDASQLDFPPAVSMGYSIVDYDADGHQDVYCNYSLQWDHNPTSTTGWIGDDGSGAYNLLFRNRGDGTFTEVATGTPLACDRRQTFASVWFHANDDHLPDLYVANDFSQNVLLINRGAGQFADHSTKSGAADFATSMGAAAGDFNNDGRSELYVANMYSKMGRRIVGQVGPDDYPAGVFAHIKGACAGNRFYQRVGEASEYTERSLDLGINDIGWAYAPATLDCDNDGNLDLYATTGFLSFDRGKPDG